MPNYPTALPGVSVQGNAYSPQDLVKFNPLAGGAPIARLQADNGWSMHDCLFKYSASEVQIFRNWHRWALRNGAYSFTMELWVEGSDGVKNTREHTCYIFGGYDVNQVGRLMHTTCKMLAIEQVTDDFDFGMQLVDLAEFFPDGVEETLIDLDELIKLMEVKWPG